MLKQEREQQREFEMAQLQKWREETAIKFICNMIQSARKPGGGTAGMIVATGVFMADELAVVLGKATPAQIAEMAGPWKPAAAENGSPSEDEPETDSTYETNSE
jgi:hypothetical protein